ncbi:uncharacterized protein LODBEIA_P56990 [Lodderomyces beijingensis]|uniref:Exonuclease 1 n=1 Tax=Lodderomyces beijingensis TaxID=1775926 RepID=A0ABP0ZUB6_9ASCO
MGVSGLLPLLKCIQDPCSLERYRGKTLAIDTYGWLHRAIVSCAEELCLGKPTRRYITSILNKIAMLRHFGINPYFVFDGASLTAKAETNAKRKSEREEARRLAEKYTRAGKATLAAKAYMKAACVSHQMAKSIMVELDKMNISYVVAPYEADPQMVYLEKTGIVDGILSEDSDLLVFGCRKLITKLRDDASCVEIDRANFNKVKAVPFLGSLSSDQVRLAAMLSGCDYTRGVPGVGIKSSVQLVHRYRDLQKVVVALPAAGKPLPEDIEGEFARATLAFQFQKVFDPRTQQVVALNEVPSSLDVDAATLESVCGQTWDSELAVKVCNGLVDPNTHEVLLSREHPGSVLGMVKLKRVGTASVKCATKVSPTSKKLRKLASTEVKTSGISKFFRPQEPETTDGRPIWISSLPAESKEIVKVEVGEVEESEDTAGSPVRKKMKPSIKGGPRPVLVTKSVNVVEKRQEPKPRRVDLNRFAFK